MIPCQRDRFAIPADVHYLNCAYMAPLSHGVIAAMDAGARAKASPWRYRPADFFIVAEDFRTRAARLAGVSPECIAIVPSASYGLAVAAANLPLARGQEVVVLGDQFPSNIYVWQDLAARVGASLRTAIRPSQDCWSAAVLDAIGPDTGIVAVPHCHWADGRVVDLIAVRARCREVGAALVLDLTQSLGAMPIDLAAVDPDFAVAACYKWLMGPYGTGMLYVAPRHHGGRPIEHNWINRAGSEDFARLVDYREDFQPGARRFDMGEKSNPPLLAGAGAGLDFLLESGVEAVAKTLAAKTEAIAGRAASLGMQAAPAGVRAAHFLSLGFSGEVPEGLTERLAQRNVHVSLRGQSLRVTPHLYNDEADIDALIAALS